MFDLTRWFFACVDTVVVPDNVPLWVEFHCTSGPSFNQLEEMGGKELRRYQARRDTAMPLIQDVIGYESRATFEMGEQPSKRVRRIPVHTSQASGYGSGKGTSLPGSATDVA